MKMVSSGIVSYLRAQYPVGTEVELVQMDDPHAPPVGTKGTVMFVDDIGTVHVAWSSGSFLGAVYGEDVIRKV